MRIGKRGFEARIKGKLRLEFGSEQLTSYAGLELVRRLLGRLEVFRELRAATARLAPFTAGREDSKLELRAFTTRRSDRCERNDHEIAAILEIYLAPG